MRAFLFALVLVYSVLGFGEEEFDFLNSIRHKKGFAAELPLSVCRSLRPHNKVVKRSHPSFNLFAFTAEKFDSTKPSVLFIQGGPGGLWSPEQVNQTSKLFPNFNAVYFDYRAGGCSAFSVDPMFDKYINSTETVQDIEAIREAYGVKVWSSVVGYSYGTYVGRRYANAFPNRVASLILEGLDSEDDLSEEETNKRLIELVSKRYAKSKPLQKTVSHERYNAFVNDALTSYLEQADLTQNLFMTAIWEDYKPTLVDLYKKHSLKLPLYFNRDVFNAIVLLRYAGESDTADSSILLLLSNFGYAKIPNENLREIKKQFQNFDNLFFPFRNPNYATSFKDSGAISWRILISMSANDENDSPKLLCTPVRTLVINGSEDLATPVDNVDKYLRDKKCASGKNTSLIVGGGGHSSLGDLKCLNAFAYKFVKGESNQNILKTCAEPVKFREY